MEEVLQKLQDPFWRLNHLYHIKSEDTGAVIQFKPYPEQTAVFEAVLTEGHKKIIIPKARRRGMSTGIDVLMYDQAIRNAGYEAGIVDRNQADASKKLENIIKTSHENLPQFMQEGLKTLKNNDDRLSFQVGDDTTSHIYAATGYRGGNCYMFRSGGGFNMLTPSGRRRFKLVRFKLHVRGRLLWRLLGRVVSRAISGIIWSSPSPRRRRRKIRAHGGTCSSRGIRISIILWTLNSRFCRSVRSISKNWSMFIILSSLTGRGGGIRTRLGLSTITGLGSIHLPWRSVLLLLWTGGSMKWR